ncbi:hypothetical protein Sste5346_008772 [Sporothrix stenoceras]|uniref:GED domain-containing protein n=1 Tax=Sporothrix stenoceras TaxID=5173 RepID=A0ABR3YN67_9PEZI
MAPGNTAVPLRLRQNDDDGQASDTSSRETESAKILTVPSTSEDGDSNSADTGADSPIEHEKVSRGPLPSPTDVPKTDEDRGPAAVPENPFENEASRVLFDAIDKLRSCGAGMFVDIPQLVIVGGQSTGKSSLLQGLTEIPFPIGMDTCTRFATLIESKRTFPGTPRQVKVTIVLPDFKTEELAEAFGAVNPASFRDFVRVQDSLTAEGFAEIVEEAATWLGLDPGTGDHHKNFALEVLKVEISGPTRADFSILDIPGIFINDLAVKPREMNGVSQMVIKYMCQPENIVICVADAGTDLMMQEIFKLANKHVDAARLIGVFTKCDRLNAADAARVADMASQGREKNTTGTSTSVVTNNPSAVPKHGWFVVRNRVEGDGGADDPDFDLGAIEKELFNQPAWSSVRADRRGTAQLRAYLSRLLNDKIRNRFPRLLANLNDILASSQSELAKLGEARTTTHLRRVYLADLARQYEIHARNALERPWQLDNARARVRSVVRVQNDAFGNEMRACGHVYEFEDHDVSDDEYWQRIREVLRPDSKDDKDKDGDGDRHGESGSESPLPSPPRVKRASATAKFKSARMVAAQAASAHVSQVLGTDELFEVICEEVQTCGCTELPGFVHPDVIRRLYRLQTQKWYGKARDHLVTVAFAVKDAARCLLDTAVPSGRGGEALNSGLWEVISELYDNALKTSLNRLKTYSDGDRRKLLQTTDPGFTQRLRLMQSLRLVTTINKAVTKAQLWGETVEELGAVLFQDAHHSSEANTVLEVHDALKVYYHFALQSFIHHVNNTIVEDFVTDPAGPLRGLSAKFVYALSDDEVDRLGGESRDDIENRQRLHDRIQKLLAAQETARGALDKARAMGM